MPFGGRDTCELYKSIDVRRWHREGRLHAGQQFPWSWTSGREPSGNINVRAEVDAVVLIYRVRSFLAGWKSIEQQVPTPGRTATLVVVVLVRLFGSGRRQTL